jgi:16S rRNA (uracil1498-N3)-methyltransferase
MRRYKFDINLEIGQEVDLSGELFKHTVIVCRNKIGDKIELLYSGKAYVSEFKEILKKSAIVKIVAERSLPNLKRPHLHLVLANPKTAVLERVLEKSVELGVKAVHLLATEKSFFKTADKIKLKRDRLSKIISQAMQQSARFEDLDLKEPLPFPEFLEFLKTQSDAKSFLLYAKSDEDKDLVKLSNVDGCEDVYLFVGAEGGFSENEVSQAVLSGVKVISLGSQILRVETACVAGLSILKSRCKIW